MGLVSESTLELHRLASARALILNLIALLDRVTSNQRLGLPPVLQDMWFQKGPNAISNVTFSNFIPQCGQQAAAVSVVGEAENFANGGDNVSAVFYALDSFFVLFLGGDGLPLWDGHLH